MARGLLRSGDIGYAKSVTPPMAEARFLRHQQNWRLAAKWDFPGKSFELCPIRRTTIFRQENRPPYNPFCQRNSSLTYIAAKYILHSL
jgi:hypothetical protein